MRFHVMLPGCVQAPGVTQDWEKELRGSDVVTIARAIDTLGYTGVLIPEHMAVGAKHELTTGGHFFDAATAQALIAGATERMQIRSMVTILPLHHPVQLAKSVATMDWLSGGRTALTVGVGWQREEYRALGVPWERRGAITDEYLAAVLELWIAEKPSFKGEFVSFADILSEPKPVQQPHPSIWVGGDSAPALRRAARFGDGWAPWLTPPADIPAKLDTIRASAGYDGSRPFDVFFSLMSMQIGMENGRHVTKQAANAPSRMNLQKSIDDCGRLAALGVTDTWVPAPSLRSTDEYVEHLHEIAEVLLPHIAIT